MYDSDNLYSDQLGQTQTESKSTEPGKKIDLALLIDGLQAEREKGITIDVYTVILRLKIVSSLLQTPLVMRSTQETWQLELQILI